MSKNNTYSQHKRLTLFGYRRNLLALFSAGIFQLLPFFIEPHTTRILTYHLSPGRLSGHCLTKSRSSMMNKDDEARQIRETRSLLQKAGQRHASLETKREALRRLISLTRTSSRELKVFAAQHFSHYFKDFPDMEEEVIDCVYDICEDSESQVRIEGYKAIVALSAESKKWTRRNTDVLVQLLQSDEPVELKQIEDSLIAHVRLDPPAAIGVLCDHCSLEPNLSAEDRQDRDNLRKLVLVFLSSRARDAVFSHFEEPDSEAERVFTSGLLKALLDADEQETRLIVKELLLPLASFATRSRHGDELLEVLLEKVRLQYTTIKSKLGPISLDPVQPYLALLDYVVLTKKAANPGPLLRFYSMTLIGKIPLQKLDQISQISVIEKLADILAVCEEVRQKDLQSPLALELTKLRNMVIDAYPHLLEKLVKPQNHDRRQWEALVTLLRACVQRREDQKWEPPSNLVPTLVALNTSAESAPPSVTDLSKKVQLLIKELNVESTEPVLPASLSQPWPTSLKRKYEGEKPPAFKGSHVKTAASHARSPNASLRRADSESVQRGSKLINREGGDVSTGGVVGGEETASTPSLLRRMDIDRNGRGDANAITTTIASRTPNLSIKGAAAKLDAIKIGEPQLPPPYSPTPTLLDRVDMSEGLKREDGHGRRRQRRHKVG